MFAPRPKTHLDPAKAAEPAYARVLHSDHLAGIYRHFRQQGVTSRLSFDAVERERNRIQRHVRVVEAMGAPHSAICFLCQEARRLAAPE